MSISVGSNQYYPHAARSGICLGNAGGVMTRLWNAGQFIDALAVLIQSYRLGYDPQGVYHSGWENDAWSYWLQWAKRQRDLPKAAELMSVQVALSGGFARLGELFDSDDFIRTAVCGVSEGWVLREPPVETTREIERILSLLNSAFMRGHATGEWKEYSDLCLRFADCGCRRCGAGVLPVATDACGCSCNFCFAMVILSTEWLTIQAEQRAAAQAFDTNRTCNFCLGMVENPADLVEAPDFGPDRQPADRPFVVCSRCRSRYWRCSYSLCGRVNENETNFTYCYACGRPREEVQHTGHEARTVSATSGLVDMPIPTYASNTTLT